MPSANGAGHAFIAIDVSKMMPTEAFFERINQMADELRNAPKAKGADRIFLPGEMEWDKREKALASGELELTDAMVSSLTALSELTGVALNIYE